jgi:hypothetical protein
VKIESSRPARSTTATRKALQTWWATKPRISHIATWWMKRASWSPPSQGTRKEKARSGESTCALAESSARPVTIITAYSPKTRL